MRFIIRISLCDFQGDCADPAELHRPVRGRAPSHSGRRANGEFLFTCQLLSPVTVKRGYRGCVNTTHFLLGLGFTYTTYLAQIKCSERPGEMNFSTVYLFTFRTSHFDFSSLSRESHHHPSVIISKARKREHGSLQ